MNTRRVMPPDVQAIDSQAGQRPWRLVWVVVAVAVVGFSASHARQGAVSGRVRNAGVVGAPRPVNYLWGVPSSTWLVIGQVGALISMVVFVVVCVVAWRRRPTNPVLLMAIAVTLLAPLDPVMNWAVFAVYNPQLWHFPEDWPLVSLSPTVEPFIAVGYAFFLLPYFPATAILRRLQARRPVDSFVSRHPLMTLAALIFVIGYVIDASLEMMLIRQGQYVFSQVLAWGSVFVGTPFQFPLLWQSILIITVMVPVGVLLYRGDTGLTVAEKLARRAGIFRSRPARGTFTVMLACITAGYLVYGASYELIKVSGLATSTACPWSYPEAKVYDPRADYERAGAPGPYSVGNWSTWLSGQPRGRPHIEPSEKVGPCLTDSR